MRRLIPCLLLAITLFSCKNNIPVLKTSPAFSSFELSYTNGWGKIFSFYTDSNHIYITPQKMDTTSYGILPDSLFEKINSTVIKIKSDTSIRSKQINCYDCAVFAIQFVNNKDTTTIVQEGLPDSIFHPMITAIEDFIKKGPHQKIHSFTWLETRTIVSPPPPKIEY